MTKDEHEQINTLAKMIDAIAIDVSVIKTVLLGVANTENGGLCETVKNNAKAISWLRKAVYILLGILIGSGILTGIEFFGV